MRLVSVELFLVFPLVFNQPWIVLTVDGILFFEYRVDLTSVLSVAMGMVDLNMAIFVIALR